MCHCLISAKPLQSHLLSQNALLRKTDNTLAGPAPSLLSFQVSVHIETDAIPLGNTISTPAPPLSGAKNPLQFALVPLEGAVCILLKRPSD